MTFLATDKLKHRSIKTYLSAVRHLQISAGFPDPSVQMPCLEYVMRGVKRAESESGGGGREWLPITPHILRQLLGVWAPTGHQQDTKLIWAASTLCFFAFMRAGELSTPTSASYNGDVHLCVQAISVDDTHFPIVMHVQIKQSKTDPFCKGVTLAIGRTGISYVQ